MFFPRMIVVAIAMGAAGCCSSVQVAVHEYAVSVRTNTQPSLVLIDRCKGGEQPACDIVKQNIQALDASASRLADGTK